MRTLAIACLTAAFLASGAHAASLTATGPVQVNSGNGYRPVTGMVEVKPGDRVLVGAGARARIAYGTDCAMNLAPNAIALVATGSPCSGRMDLGRHPRPTEYPHGVAMNTTMMIIGGGFAAATAAAFIHTVRSSSKSPASP